MLQNILVSLGIVYLWTFENNMLFRVTAQLSGDVLDSDYLFPLIGLRFVHIFIDI